MTVLTALWFDKGKSNEGWFLAFEAYGHAMAAAAALELQLALFVIKKKFMDMSLGRAPQMSREDSERFIDATRKRTFPKLITSLRKNFKLSDEVLESLELAKAARDSLAHDFWHMHIGFIQSPEGVELIVKLCSLDSWHFKQLSADLEREIGFSVDEFVRKSAETADQNRSTYDEFIDVYF